MSYDISDADFEAMVARALDELPKEQVIGLDNVSIVTQSRPDAEQVKKIRLRGDSLLLGLYEGIPLPRRTGNYSLVLPDKITIFKDEIIDFCHYKGAKDTFPAVKHTLWHEIAHFYGLDHPQIHDIEQNWR
jgi:predicted Zn-dependent protease with MMP-like domain